MNTIKARIYGTENRQGSIVDFRIMGDLPQKGEPIMRGDVWTYGESRPARLDPEQRTGDDEDHYLYDFFEIDEIDEDGEVDGLIYVAIPKE